MLCSICGTKINKPTRSDYSWNEAVKSEMSVLDLKHVKEPIGGWLAYMIFGLVISIFFLACYMIDGLQGFIDGSMSLYLYPKSNYYCPQLYYMCLAEVDRSYLKATIQSLFTFAIWGTYLYKSKRVAETCTE